MKVVRKPVPADGNCQFASLSVILGTTQDTLRRAVRASVHTVHPDFLLGALMDAHADTGTATPGANIADFAAQYYSQSGNEGDNVTLYLLAVSGHMSIFVYHNNNGTVTEINPGMTRAAVLCYTQMGKSGHYEPVGFQWLAGKSSSVYLLDSNVEAWQKRVIESLRKAVR